MKKVIGFVAAILMVLLLLTISHKERAISRLEADVSRLEKENITFRNACQDWSAIAKQFEKDLKACENPGTMRIQKFGWMDKNRKLKFIKLIDGTIGVEGVYPLKENISEWEDTWPPKHVRITVNMMKE